MRRILRLPEHGLKTSQKHSSLSGRISGLTGVTDILDVPAILSVCCSLTFETFPLIPPIAICKLSVLLAFQARLDELVSDRQLNPQWRVLREENSYSTSQEILGYFKEIVAKHNLSGFAKLNHRVLGAWWNDDLGEWKIKVQPGDDPHKAFFDTGHILINATGVLKCVKWPPSYFNYKFSN